LSLEDYLGKLDPKTAKRVKTAQEIELVKFPLASVRLTEALGGGIGAGRVTLIYGNTSSGKSVLMMQTVGQLQKQGKVCAWVDVEGTYEKGFAARLGIDNDNLILIQKKSFGGVTDEIMPHIRAGIDLIVIDSISDALPEVFVDKDGQVNNFDNMKQMGAHAKSCTMMINAIHYENERTAVVLISQTTTFISSTYTKQVPHGGQKTLFGSSQIVKLTSSNTEAEQKKGHVTVGDRIVEIPVARSVKAYVEKNKLGPQSQTVTYDLYYAGDFVGVDYLGEVVDLAISLGIINKSGGWLSYGDEKAINGRPDYIESLRENEVKFKAICDEVNMVMTGEVPIDVEEVSGISEPDREEIGA
jgi:recombination protein RecA